MTEEGNPMQNDDWVEDYDETDTVCDHDDHDTDILDGRCRCWRCGESWYATTEQIDAQLRWQSEYCEAMEREDRRQWWSDLFYAVRRPLVTIHWELSKRGWIGRRSVASDDDIPF